MKKDSTNSIPPTEYGVYQRTSAPFTNSDLFLLLSPPSQPKMDPEYCLDDEDLENKENVSPSETTCSTTTPLKPTSRIQAWKSSERAPLGDISHYFCPKAKRIEKVLAFTPISGGASPPAGKDQKCSSDGKKTPAFRMFR